MGSCSWPQGNSHLGSCVFCELCFNKGQWPCPVSSNRKKKNQPLGARKQLHHITIFYFPCTVKSNLNWLLQRDSKQLSSHWHIGLLLMPNLEFLIFMVTLQLIQENISPIPWHTDTHARFHNHDKQQFAVVVCYIIYQFWRKIDICIDHKCTTKNYA